MFGRWIHRTTDSVYSPKTRRRASEISPTVASASTAAVMAGIRFSPVRARVSTAATAAAADLRGLEFRIDAKRGHGHFLFRNELVYADNDLLSALDGALVFVGGLLDFALHVADFNGAQHSAQRVDFLDVVLRARFNFVRQFFNGVGAADGIHRIRDAGFVRDDLLRAQREQRSIFGGKRERFVERVRVQRLAS